MCGQIFSESVTPFVLTLCELQVHSGDSAKRVTVIDILRHNIDALLEDRRMRPADLVRLVSGGPKGRRTNSWLSRILNPPQNPKERRGMRLVDVERVAKVFGLAAHELLTPGISRYTERRQNRRRVTTDRRVKDRRVKPFPPTEVFARVQK